MTIKTRLDALQRALDSLETAQLRAWVNALPSAQQRALRKAVIGDQPLMRVTGFEDLTDEELDRLIAGEGTNNHE